MKVFLIILAVIVVIFAVILSLSAEVNIVFEDKWTTRVRVAFIEKEVSLSKILNFLLFPEKAAAEVSEETKDKSSEKKSSEKKDKPSSESFDSKEKEEAPAKEEPKPNYIKKIWDDEGFVGIMLLFTNLIETVNSAVTTLFRGLHIYSLYVKMIVAGYDAADCARSYGKICGIYYPLKGMILNGMKVDMYDDYVQPDFIAPKSEYGFQLIASINVALVLKIALKAGKVFVVNLIKNKKS
ncbi:MAG: DUF2953 domain-containing protein [Oscillospiraceae bacterium]|nr:DUF2953 domain-containing protein [Oscillospiraceae bacterium]